MHVAQVLFCFLLVFVLYAHMHVVCACCQETKNAGMHPVVRNPRVSMGLHPGCAAIHTPWAAGGGGQYGHHYRHAGGPTIMADT
jgi:hypothetical protein